MEPIGRRILADATRRLLLTGVSLGLGRDELMAEAGLDEQQLADRDAYLPFERQVDLGNAIVARRPGVDVGFAMLNSFGLSDLGVLGYLITNSRTLADALDVWIRYQGLLTDAVRWTIETGDQARICIEAPPEYERLGHPVIGLVGLWVKLGRRLTGARLMPVEVLLRCAPTPAPEELERIFGAKIRFRAPRNELVFPLEVLPLPVVGGSSALQGPLRQLAEAQLSALGDSGSFTRRLQSLLIDRIPEGMTSKGKLSRELGVSQRTMSRRLRAEKTNFSEVLDQTRRHLAEAWLGDPRQAIYEVALLLGYSEPSTFHRAFRRWTGESPQAWRRAQMT